MIYLSLLEEKLNSKKAKVCIIGLGYVGLPISLTFAEKGFMVMGLDIDKSKIDKINSGKSYINHISEKRINDAIKSGYFSVTDNYEIVKEQDCIIICVPTPLTKYREPDLNFIINTMDMISPYFQKGQLLSLESTTYPGTSEEILKPYIINKDLKIGEDFFLVYSPEREDPGNKFFDFKSIPKIVGGFTKSCTKLGECLYKSTVNEVITVKNTKTAEMVKLLENIHRAVNIGLMNELKPLANLMGIDIYEVISAAATKPFGFVPYYPGPGLGGHCIPIDPFYLTWKAKEFGVNTKFIELAGEINHSMPNYVVDKISETLNLRGKCLKNSKILILGICYKKNVDDMRESPSVEIMKILEKREASISYSDPFFKKYPSMSKSNFNLQSVDINSEILKSFDAVLIATDHDSFNYKEIYNSSKLIIDTRGRFKEDFKVVRA